MLKYSSKETEKKFLLIFYECMNNPLEYFISCKIDYKTSGSEIVTDIFFYQTGKN